MQICPGKRCSMRHCFCTIFDDFPLSLKVSWKFDVYVLQRNWKGKFIIGSAISFIISYTSVINTCKMLWWIAISLVSVGGLAQQPVQKICQEVVWQWKEELKTIASPKLVKYLSKVLQWVLSIFLEINNRRMRAS